MTRIVLISDTHDKVGNLILPYGEILLHAGDYSMHGGEQESYRFFDWFQSQPHPHKIFIAGNHDLSMQVSAKKKVLMEYIATNCPGITYLEDELVEVEGIKIYGSPYTPSLGGWAFGLPRGFEMMKHWARVPSEVDILLTHGPPMHIGDHTVHGAHAGCAQLYDRIVEINPKIHVFGHIHEAYGMYSDRAKKCDTTFINVAAVDELYYHINDPIVIEYEHFI